MDAEDASTTISDGVERLDPSDDEFLLEKGETAYHVYKGLWNDFYDWEYDHCRQVILGLARTETSFGDLPSELDDFSGLSNHRSHQYTEWFTDERWDGQNSDFSISRLPTQFLVVEEALSPHPRYMACTPTSSSIMYPPNYLWTAAFIPYSDDRKFPIENYLLHFKTFGWQTDFWDPDRELVFHETARRLHFTYQFSYAEIDSLQIYHLSLRQSPVKGSLWDISQRDILLWPGSEMSMVPQLRTRHVDKKLSLYDNVAKDTILFCDNLNCIRSACMTHEHSHPIFPPKPSVTNEEIKTLGGPPCNRDCYKIYLLEHSESEMAKMVRSWNENDFRQFKSVSTIIPDTTPCDLAVICRKPCMETYIYRLKCISDDKILEEREQETRRPPSITFKFAEDTWHASDDKPDQALPCYHPGPCNQFSNCGCYNARKRCKRTCRCLRNCNLRFMGCKCGSSRSCFEGSDCPCQQMGRECDPELCLTCDASRNSCRNTGLQAPRSVPVWIRMSDYGLGAFAMGNIEPQKYIGEYVGEFIKDETGPLAIIQKFLGLNYSFTLTETMTLDSHSVGNETRYLNHANDPNCYAKVKLVNGDVKIGICTNSSIKQNQELSLDYGEAYWNA